MPVKMNDNSILEQLQTDGQRQVLDIIISLREFGLDEDLSPPLVVVCGDQSSGKTSVLEALTNITFSGTKYPPTKFATEIILRREPIDRMMVKVIPDSTRPVEEREKIEQFSPSITNFGDLPTLLDSAMEIMGISNAQGASGKTFANDILSIEIEGPSRPQVILVDIPGLIPTDATRVPDPDIAMVEEIMDRYISQPRTICLAVVQATKDFFNQPILQKLRKFDPQGERTLGVITKADRIPLGSRREAQLIQLAKNELMFLELGWHIPFCDCLLEQPILDSLPEDKIGIEMLRLRLSDIQFEHIKNQLPGLIRKLEDALRNAKTELVLLGDARLTLVECRGYLTELSMACHKICKASIEGHYEDQYFNLNPGEPSSSGPKSRITRLRAVIHRATIDFEDILRTKGYKYSYDELLEMGENGNQAADSSTEDMKTWLDSILFRSQGGAPRGDLNSQLVAEIYWEQCSSWETLASDYIEEVCGLCEEFLTNLLTNQTPQHIRTRLWSPIIAAAMRKRREAAFDELKKILDDSKSTLINDHLYYANNVGRYRAKRLKVQLQPNLSKVNTITMDSAVTALCPKTTKDLEKLNCREALDCLMALYVVKERVFLANVATQVVERHIVKGLESIFSPLGIAKLSDDKIKEIAVEPAFITRQRNMLVGKIRELEEGQRIFNSAMGLSTLLM